MGRNGNEPRKKSELPSVVLLREALDYDSESGNLIWKARPRHHFKTDRAHTVTNTRYAGRIAGSLEGKQGYLTIMLNEVTLKAHRVAWALTYGEWPADLIDHINGNKLDNRLSNLRACTRAENNRNRTRRHTSGAPYKGISFHRLTGKWSSEIAAGSTREFLGLFDTPEAAHSAYCAAAKKLHGEFAHA